MFFLYISLKIPTAEFNSKVISDPQTPCITCSCSDILQAQDQAGTCAFLPLWSEQVPSYSSLLLTRTPECCSCDDMLQSPGAAAQHCGPSLFQCPHSQVCFPSTQRCSGSSISGLCSADSTFKQMEEFPCGPSVYTGQHEKFSFPFAQ